MVVRTSDPACDPGERAVLEPLGFVTMLMLPLVSRGETIGLMEFADVTDRSWDAEMEFFGALTDVVAAAVHNAVLHAEFREAQRLKAHHHAEHQREREQPQGERARRARGLRRRLPGAGRGDSIEDGHVATQLIQRARTSSLRSSASTRG